MLEFDRQHIQMTVSDLSNSRRIFSPRRNPVALPQLLLSGNEVLLAYTDDTVFFVWSFTTMNFFKAKAKSPQEVVRAARDALTKLTSSDKKTMEKVCSTRSEILF